MQTTDPKKIDEQTELPDFVEDTASAENFGDTSLPEAEQESFPENGAQSQTGAATNNSKMDIEPTDDGDSSLAGTDD